MRLLFDINRRGTAILMVTHNLAIIRAFPARHIRLDETPAHETAPEA